MKFMKLINNIVAGISFISLFSCNTTFIDKETTTSGHIKIYADESFAPIINAEVEAYKYSYPEATINQAFLPEDEAIQAFVKDTARVVFLTRELNSDEKKYFNSIKLEPKTTHIATDAIAFIVNPNNPDSLLSTFQINQIIQAKTSVWNKLGGKNKGNEAITLVFDQNNSSNIRYASENLKLNFKNKNIFAAGSNEKVIDYVSSHPFAIGVIGVNWVSDRDDTTTLNFTKKIKVVGISSQEHPSTELDYFQPFQAYIAQGIYPFTRKLYLISREPKTGLGTGLSAYISSDIGQKIILKSGLLPATAPIRIVKFHKQE